MLLDLRLKENKKMKKCIVFVYVFRYIPKPIDIKKPNPQNKQGGGCCN